MTKKYQDIILLYSNLASHSIAADRQNNKSRIKGEIEHEILFSYFDLKECRLMARGEC